jgi:hypothetical protein
MLSQKRTNLVPEKALNNIMESSRRREPISTCDNVEEIIVPSLWRTWSLPLRGESAAHALAAAIVSGDPRPRRALNPDGGDKHRAPADVQWIFAYMYPALAAAQMSHSLYLHPSFSINNFA